MTITLQDKQIENKLLDLSKKLKIKVDDLVKQFLKQQIEEIDKPLSYKNLDPFKHMQILDEEINEENLQNPFKNINSEEFAKDLRKHSWK